MVEWVLSIVVLCGWGGAPNALGQGVLHFTNHALRSPPVDAPVFGYDGVTPLAGGAYLAQLYAGPIASSESSLSPIVEPVPFRTGTGAGYWVDRLVEVPGVFAGETATVQVRVWEAVAGSFEGALAGAGLHGTSRLLEIELGYDQFGLPPPLWGLESFSLVPEPGSISLGVLGMVALLLGNGSWFRQIATSSRPLVLTHRSMTRWGSRLQARNT